MDKQLYVVYFESANYCGYGEHVLVWAADEEDARDRAYGYAEEFYFEQDEEQYADEHAGEDMDDVVWASILSVELLAGSEHEPYAGQYHTIGTEE